MADNVTIIEASKLFFANFSWCFGSDDVFSVQVWLVFSPPGGGLAGPAAVDRAGGLPLGRRLCLFHHEILCFCVVF